MECPACGTEMVGFRVPVSFRDYAPGNTESAVICPSCLTLAADDTTDGEFERILTEFPQGEAGAAMALALGLLVESVTLKHDTVIALFEEVATRGSDPWLILERLAASPTIDPSVDLARLRTQLEQLT